jgi:type IV pilus assembly protein PilV
MRLRNRAHSRGFNLIEVMVALVVISVGLLGIAKMQALALASTGTAKIRSLAALEAASLAATVRADRAYWSAVTANPFTVTFQNGAIATATDAALKAVKACTSVGACTTAVQITAYDLQDWANEVANQLPNGQATLSCAIGPIVAPATTAPVSCNIVIGWNETRAGVNTQSSGSAAAALTAATNYTLYVEP